MYLFVRFTGVVVLVLGLILMLVGFIGAVYVLVQNETLLPMINGGLLAQSGMVLQDARPYAAALGLVMFITGMFASALGQLMLVFIDIAINGHETNRLLRGSDSRADSHL
jgi:hypothetical protein